MATSKLTTTMQIKCNSEDGGVESQNCRCKLTAVKNELKLILAEVNIIFKWIERKFGTSIINRNSHLFNECVHKSEEIESLSESLALPYDLEVLEAPKHNFHNRKLKPQKGKLKSTTVEMNPKNTGSDLACISGVTTEKSQKYARKTGKVKPCEIETKKLRNAAHNPNNNLVNVNIKVTKIADDLEKELSPTYKETSCPRKKSTVRSNHNNVKASVLVKPGTANDTDTTKASQIKSTEKTSNGTRAKSVDWRKYACSGPKQCDECGKVVMGTSSLKQHKRMHADERPFECLECKQKFRYRKNLKIHTIALHNGERHLQCSFCGKKFYAPKDLKIHERTHTGHKPYACHVCPKRFNIKEHLTMHIRVHTGERPYKCPICDKSFSQANSLRIHKKIHEKVVEDKPKKKRQSAKSAAELLSADGNNKMIPQCSTTENNANNNVIPHLHPASVSTFQLMVPTMQTVTAAIVSVSTVTSPFPCINLSHPQAGNENAIGPTNYVPLMGSLENSAQTNEQIHSSLVTPSSVLVGDVSKPVIIPDVAKNNVQISSISTNALGNITLTPENTYEAHNDKESSCIYQNLK